MTRVGLVLGAGGIVGQSYQAGALAALEHDLGWDPRDADVIVGSSAGSVTGALLRLGVPASDLAAWAVKAPLSVAGATVIDHLEANRREFDGFAFRDWARPWRVPSAALMTRLVREPWRFRPSTALMTLLPSGRIDITEPAGRLDDLAPERWPDGLWVCGVRRGDGRRVVFGAPGSPPASLAHAVAASCAIPGVFSPVTIGGVEYIDGDAHSPTNADVLRRERLDLVVAISPMSAAGGRMRTVDGPYRWVNHRRLERELRSLRSRGTRVVRIEPAAGSLAAMGINPMASDRSDRIILASFIETGAYVGTEAVRARLAGVARRTASGVTG